MKMNSILGFKKNKTIYKIMSLIYFFLVTVISIVLLLDDKFENISYYDFIITKVYSIVLITLFYSPYIFLSNNNLLFLKNTLKHRLGGLVVFILFSIILAFGIIDNLHSDEFLADRQNHSFVEISVEAATCEKSGKSIKRCNYCGLEKKEIISSIGHNMLEVASKTDKTTNQIEKTLECSNCGKQDKVFEKIIETTSINNESETTEKDEINYNKIQSDDFNHETNQIIVWNEYQFELPQNWEYQYTENNVGMYIYPNKENPPVFCFTPLETTDKYDLSNKDVQMALASSIIENLKKQLGVCSFVNYEVPTEHIKLSDGSKLDVTGRYTLYLTCSSIIEEKPCTGYVIAFYLGDTLYSFNLFEYDDSPYTFYNDLENITKTIKQSEKSIETTEEITTEPFESTTIIETTTEATTKIETYVYITNSGSKYHTSTCRWTSKSCIKILYEEAVEKGYTPCGTCKPYF